MPPGLHRRGRQASLACPPAFIAVRGRRLSLAAPARAAPRPLSPLARPHPPFRARTDLRTPHRATRRRGCLSPESAEMRVAPGRRENPRHDGPVACSEQEAEGGTGGQGPGGPRRPTARYGRTPSSFRSGCNGRPGWELRLPRQILARCAICPVHVAPRSWLSGTSTTGVSSRRPSSSCSRRRSSPASSRPMLIYPLWAMRLTSGRTIA